MSARIIDGKAHAVALRERISCAVAELKDRHGLIPGLAVVLVGEDSASRVYVRNKAEQTRAAGMVGFSHILPADTGESELLALIARLNADPAVHGVLVQLPLSGHLNADAVINAIDPAKDVDGFHVANAGRLATGQRATAPCTPLGCLMLLRDLHGDLTGMEAVIVGRSNIVGKPMAQLLLRENCTVTLAHSRSRDLPVICRRADILVAAVGVAGLIRGEWVKPGATVIDVGINRIAAEEGRTRLTGDVAFDEAAAVAGAITPVPGGVGPMTIACLLANTVIVCCRSRGIPVPEGLEL